MHLRPNTVLLTAAGCVIATLTYGVAQAQHITIDGSLSPAQVLAGPSYTIGAALGKQVGGNLFHSFGLFGLSTGESANFTGPSTVSNIVGRVTGGSRSSIDGAVKSSIAGANLYLINPAGIVFGPNATVNVSGSFHASTADYLKMSDGAKFRATNPSGSTLSAAPPAAFGFLNAAPPAITVNGSQLTGAPGTTLGMVGGPVTIGGAATLAVPAGTIRLSGVASTGEVPVDPTNAAGSTVTRHAPVRLAGGSVLNVSDPVNLGSGNVFVHAGALTIDGSGVFADNFGAGPGGRIALAADTQITLSNGAAAQALALSSGTGAAIILTTGAAGGIGIDRSTVQTGSAGTGQGGDLSAATGSLSLTNGGGFESNAAGTGNTGAVTVNAGSLTISGGAVIGTSTLAAGAAGNVIVNVTGAVSADGSATPLGVTGINSQTSAGSTGNAGAVLVTAGSLSLLNDGTIGTATFGTGNAGNVALQVAGAMTIDGTLTPNGFTGISSESGPAVLGNSGSITVTAGSMTLRNAGLISSTTFGAGNAGPITIDTAGALIIDGTGAPNVLTGIASQADLNATGNASSITIHAGSLSLVNAGAISTTTFGPGAGGSIDINVATSFLIDGSRASNVTGIVSVTQGTGNAGRVVLSAGSGAIQPNGRITTSTGAAGAAGSIALDVTGALVITGTNNPAITTGVQSNAALGSTGNAGQIRVTAGSIALTKIGTISTNTFGPGSGGSVTATIAGSLTIDGGSGTTTSGIVANAKRGGTGNAGTVTVTAGSISLTNLGQISSSTFAAGNGGNVSVAVSGNIAIDGAVGEFNSGIFSDANAGSSGNGGQVAVSAGTLSLTGGGGITSTTFAAGNGGNVSVTVAGLLSVDGASSGGFVSGVASQAFVGSTGNAGQVAVSAGAMLITNGGVVSTATFGPGNGGDVVVAVAGLLSIDGGAAAIPSGIASDTAHGRTGNAGRVSVTAGSLSEANGAVITTSTSGPGAAGDVRVDVAGQLSVGGRSLITSNANSGSTGNAGRVTIIAAGLSLSDIGQISSTTFSSGQGGDVTVAVAGLLSADGGQAIAPSGIFAHADPGSTGNAGLVIVSAGALALTNGSEISTSTFGPGNGGDVSVTVAGAASLDGKHTVINSNSNRGSTGNAGRVSLVAGSLTVGNHAQIATLTNGPGSGGNVEITVRSGMLLTGPGPEITAESNGTGNAGSIQVAAASLQLMDGASISTQAATANGGNITLTVQGLFYLLDSEVTTSVDGAKGNGGNIVIDPRFVVLNNSRIIAQAVGGNGGNISITAGQYLASDNSLVSASSQLGISGAIDISGPQVALDKSLVVLPSELRSAPEVFRDRCSARNGLPRSTLVDGGRGGLPQDPDATIPALYLAGRSVGPAVPGRGAGLTSPPLVAPPTFMRGPNFMTGPIFTTAVATRLTIGCRR